MDTNCAATPFLVSSDSVAPPPRRWTGLFPPISMIGANPGLDERYAVMPALGSPEE